jgi:two-component system OmpR family sensor kinase
MLDRIQAAFDAQRRFTADASHELRSPLTAMRGEMDLALRRERSSEEYRDVLNSAREEVVRLSRIVEGLLTLARSDSGAMHPRLVRGDLTELLEEAVGRTSAEAEARGVDLRLVGSGRLPAVFDPDLVSQMIGNLVQNAVRFAGSAGRVGVRISQTGTDAVITVEDSGPGVPPGGEHAVFERFWRADPSRTPARAPEGIGLGLAIARAIAEAHGGSISASNNSTLGGARLEVRIPILSDPILPDPARRSSEPAIA